MNLMLRIFVPALTCGLAASAQNVQPATAGADAIAYPRVNLATSFEVDPNWPKRPPDIAWGAVPGISVDRHDNVWIFTRTNPTVQVYAPDGRYLFGWRDDRPGAASHFIRIDREDNVWMADVGLHVVRKVSRDGKPLLTLGTEGEPGEDARHFFKPTDIAFAPNGDIFVSDGYGNARVVHFDRRGKFIKAWGQLGTKPGEFSNPHSIGCDSKGRLYVADRNNVRVQVFDQKGRVLDVWQNVLVPWGIWITPKDEIWVCGSSPMTWSPGEKVSASTLGTPPKDQLFMEFNRAGRVLLHWTVPKGEDDHEKPGELNWVHSIALDSKGNVYLGDIKGKKVQKFLPRG